jgi:hypothetical protein
LKKVGTTPRVCSMSRSTVAWLMWHSFGWLV